MVQNGPPYLSVKKNSGGQREEGHGVVHHLQQEHHQSMKEGSHKKVKKTRIVQNGPPYLSVKKKFRWTARVRTWSSPPSSARTSSSTKILGANHPTHHIHQPIHPANAPNHPPTREYHYLRNSDLKWVLRSLTLLEPSLVIIGRILMGKSSRKAHLSCCQMTTFF